ncbi:uncharacterized protein SCHCODRAFT_02629785 [Schizophyllum commune H4-8]|uniref:uncharacterized protein n=1 Tax=Schizophyllum commune (strain H4-8 / FGSC 9210) TaxID=578458 RepID=UPI00215EB9E7|nr:uncharacterized protein SCHCODRAFT_02629785 [Schizophyllum commune H4-8]KAI5891681.1 hypothetical protein SCHCODRAFT_02629785 [Schizophyllum commune H4-8]
MRAVDPKVSRVIARCNFTKAFHVTESMLLPRPLIEYPALLFAHDLPPLELSLHAPASRCAFLSNLHVFQTSRARKRCCMHFTFSFYRPGLYESCSIPQVGLGIVTLRVPFRISSSRRARMSPLVQFGADCGQQLYHVNERRMRAAISSPAGHSATVARGLGRHRSYYI